MKKSISALLGGIALFMCKACSSCETKNNDDKDNLIEKLKKLVANDDGSNEIPDYNAMCYVPVAPSEEVPCLHCGKQLEVFSYDMEQGGDYMATITQYGWKAELEFLCKDCLVDASSQGEVVNTLSEDELSSHDVFIALKIKKEQDASFRRIVFNDLEHIYCVICYLEEEKTGKQVKEFSKEEMDFIKLVLGK